MRGIGLSMSEGTCLNKHLLRNKIYRSFGNRTEHAMLHYFWFTKIFIYNMKCYAVFVYLVDC